MGRWMASTISPSVMADNASRRSTSSFLQISLASSTPSTFRRASKLPMGQARMLDSAIGLYSAIRHIVEALTYTYG
jgi:hypothetical protein